MADNSFKAGDIALLDGKVCFVLCVRGEWCWVVKNNGLNDPETISHSILEHASEIGQ